MGKWLPFEENSLTLAGSLKEYSQILGFSLFLLLFLPCMLCFFFWFFLVDGFHFTSYKVIKTICSQTVVEIRSLYQHASAINFYPCLVQFLVLFLVSDLSEFILLLVAT